MRDDYEILNSAEVHDQFVDQLMKKVEIKRAREASSLRYEFHLEQAIEQRKEDQANYDDFINDEEVMNQNLIVNQN